MKVSDIDSKVSLIKNKNLQIASGSVVWGAINTFSDLSKNGINVKDVFQYKTLSDIQKRTVKEKGINGICSALFFGLLAKTLTSGQRDNDNSSNVSKEDALKKQGLKLIGVSALFGVLMGVGKIYSYNLNLKDVFKFKTLNSSQKDLMKSAGITGIKDALFLLFLNMIASASKMNSNKSDN